MSRISKWKLEKTKVKVVFRLQFHATHVPQAGWDKLFISFAPADSAKATAKTTKANVRNGACKWADPIYETTRLLHDSRSKLYDDKLYRFVVAMGSSRASILGEASINLADYADALTPSVVALPLHGCSSGTILHVTVQLLTSKTGFREFEQQRELREKGLQTGIDLTSRDGVDRVSSEEMTSDHIEKINARVRLRPEPKELPLLEEEMGLVEEYAGSPVGFDGSSNTSGSLYAEKHDNSSTHEIDSLNYSVDNDLAIACEENNRLKGCLEMAESTILELKQEVCSLQNHADELGIQTQKFVQQVSAEISSTAELAEEVSIMKLECSNLKGDLQHLMSLNSISQFDTLCQGTHLRWEKGLLVVEEKMREIQRKVYLSLDDREARLLHLDFEALLTVLVELKQENLPSKITNSAHKSEQLLLGHGLDVDLFQPPNMLHCLSVPSILPQEHDSLSATKAMEDKIFELLRELDESKGEREGLIRKMNQMECYYEALVQELEETQKQMLVELQNLRSEHSSCVYTITTSNAEIDSIRREINEQILSFNEERHELGSICKELERRANTSEAALKRARLNYSIAVDQLQKDLDLLSFQVLSMFETNENLIRKTCSENLQLQNYNVAIKKQVTGGDVLEEMKKSLLLQEGLYHKVEEELSEMHLVNIYLDVFSKILQESLLQGRSDIILMEKKINELVQQLDLTTESKKLLISQLQSSMADMTHQNQFLELKLEGLGKENFLLTDKIAQLEALLRDCSTYKSKYLVCLAEKGEMALLLEQESFTKEKLQEELKLVKGEQNELAYCNEDLQKLVKSLEDRLGNLLASCNKKLNGAFWPANSVSRDLESMNSISVMSQLEEFHFNACDKTLQLLEEKKVLENERDGAQLSSRTAKSEVLILKQTFEHELQNMDAKLETSHALVEKLQLELETLANKLHISLEVEETYAKQNKELLANLENMEHDLQHLTSKNMNLAKEISGMNSLTEELGISKLTIDLLTQEMQELKIFLEDKDAENTKLASELDSVKEKLRSLLDELDLERSSKDNLQVTVDHLIFERNEKNEKLLQFSQQDVELVHFRQLASYLEREKKNLEEERDQAQVLSSSASSEILIEKKKFKHDIQKVATELEASNALVEKLQADFESLLNKIQLSLEAEEKYANQGKELVDYLSLLECDFQDITSKNMDLVNDILGLSTVIGELEHCKLTIFELRQGRHDLTRSLQDKAAENVRLESKLDSLKEKFRFLSDELDLQRSSNDNLQGTIDHLTLQLSDKDEKLLLFFQQEVELEHCRQQASELERDKKILEYERDQAQALSNSTSSEFFVTKQKFQQAMQNMGAQLEASNALVEKLELEFQSFANKLQTSLEAEDKYTNQNKELLANLLLLEGDLHDLASNHMDHANGISDVSTVSEELESYKSTLAEVLQERQALKISLQDKAAETDKLESEIDTLKEHSKSLHVELCAEISVKDNLHGIVEHLSFQLKEKNDQLLRQEAELVHHRQLTSDLECETSELLEYIIFSDVKLIVMSSQYEIAMEEFVLSFDSSERQFNELDVKLPEKLPVLSEEEIDTKMMSDQGGAIMIMIFKAKLDELKDQFASLGENNDDLAMLQSKCDELNSRLSEQILKTEEFKNLATHLKELKDKSEAECREACEKRDSEGSSTAERESLRVAFIKEQYETRLQDLRQQLSFSKKHAEEMLLKLQDSVDELENMKRSEASNLKRNEELSLKVLELEAELQSLVFEKREKINAHDRIKAELECALLSLECCKEEKQRVEAALQESYNESQGNGLKESDLTYKISSTGRPFKLTDQHSIVLNDRTEDVGVIPIEDREYSTVPENVQPSQDTLVPKNGHGPTHASLEQSTLPQDDPEHLAIINHRVKVQSLKSSMDQLQHELERMKNENSLLSDEDQHSDASFLDLQSELLQLNKANEELRIRFPSFNELPGNGNALERVFALEIELAESLQAKKKSNVLFQSSFLKQHSDEQAIYQSFRDINDLIKEMLELKGKHSAMETELKEMHDRYSQLSLQHAEVEGERQKLMMTLKNSHSPSPKKFTLFNGFTSAVPE